MRLLCCTLALVVACSRAGDESRVRRAPVPPPPPSVEVPVELDVPVEVEGQVAASITRQRLVELTPDYADAERRAWRLTRVLTGSFRAGTVVEAVGAAGVAMVLPYPTSNDAPQPVLGLTRRGEVIAAMVAPEDPFPDYHGRGGRLRRPGDPLPRVMAVKQLRVHREEARPLVPGGASSGTSLSDLQRRGAARVAALRFEIDGKPLVPPPSVAGAPVMVTRGDDGETRPAWSLREIARVAAGAGARVVRVVGSAGQIALDEAAWNDSARLPVLRVNRDGVIHFSWLGGDGRLAGGDEVRAVQQLSLVRAGSR